MEVTFRNGKTEKEKEEKKQHRVFWFFIKLQIFLMVLILGGLCFFYFGGYADKVAKLHSEAVELVQKSDKNTFLPARTSTLYDTNGDEISETATTKKADYVKYEDIPQNFVNCMVSIEDKKFYKHNGVDIKAIVRAAKSIIKKKRELPRVAVPSRCSSPEIFIWIRTRTGNEKSRKCS